MGATGPGPPVADVEPVPGGGEGGRLSIGGSAKAGPPTTIAPLPVPLPVHARPGPQVVGLARARASVIPARAMMIAPPTTRGPVGWFQLRGAGASAPSAADPDSGSPDVASDRKSTRLNSS